MSEPAVAGADAYDVFNGDADGICALHQLRLAEPRQAELVTGVKRDICLLRRLGQVEKARITVLDISLDRNREALLPLLANCEVLYIDHHYPGEIPVSEHLTVHIDPSPEMCTSLIADQLLDGRYRAWAVAAAFGDNLHAAARRAAEPLGLPREDLDQLRELGELFNYNGYGRSVEDLHFHPADLYRAVQPFADPLEFCRVTAILPVLREGFVDDLRRARQQLPVVETVVGRIFRFPGEPWARRVAGVFCNEKARERPKAACALLVDNNDGTYLVSVRAPLATREGADRLCRRFPTGGGRAAAAGINALPASRLAEFRQAFEEVFG